MVRSLTWALECDRPQRRRSVLLQVLEVDRGKGRRQTRRIHRSKFDEAKLQRSGQQAGSVSALDSDVLLKISECTSAKGMWDTLEELHKNLRSDLVDKEESSAGSISSINKVEVCLMTKGELESSQVSTTSSNKCESYFQLLDAFQEIHEEAKRLTFFK